MKLCAALAVAFLLLASPAFAGACGDPGNLRLSAIINIGAATTTQIAPLVANQRIYVCSFFGSLAGTTPSITFKYGTGTDCATGAVAMSGTILPVTGSLLSAGSGDDMMTTPPGQAVCGTTVGAGSSFQGVMSYVQK